MSLGTLLTELRLARGWSQLRVAEQLCAASGVPTISRHEVSRWEHRRRVPGEFWLGWLAAVLDVPVADLTTAAAAARLRTAGRDEASTGYDLGAGPTRGVGRLRQELLTAAHAWLADPTEPLANPREPLAGPTEPLAGPMAGASVPLVGPMAGGSVPLVGSPTDPGPTPELPLDGAGLARLRRLDDLVGGEDLLPSAIGQLAVATARRATGRAGRRALPVVAEAAQLAGWLSADAGDPAGALHAYRLALATAATVGDRALGAHVLGSAGHLLTAGGDPRGGLLLARTGYLGVRRTGPAGLRALLLHRIALAAALCGRRRSAEAALTAAERTAGRRKPAREPSWLYWLDEDELAAMSGRCLAALRRPLRAEPLLTAALARTGEPRTSAIYGAWLARTYLDLGEPERAGEVADAALLDAVRSGSARAAAELAVTGRRLAAYRGEPAGRRHASLAASARRYLPEPAPTVATRGPS
ncbi:helix-turn-helix domain-containing protein [Plantactinospora soyae]|uniref:Transcriptional regulator with XRE-family HTH domain/tetratricopeptide (TPR) repeat protein n=1 Tax=Plantactinospora soyae TaxID=1544732 RepID=A0A927RAI9_9ACTN|nr:helix-turn-helix transcriptional regulator [Plantactinospora soyae]MBE1492419.1 transcriptional regulator with XRE-family HTH domain/tetratricopeptide (TPR) repeat protein [Plantactinospora soyae]